MATEQQHVDSLVSTQLKCSCGGYFTIASVKLDSHDHNVPLDFTCEACGKTRSPLEGAVADRDPNTVPSISFNLDEERGKLVGYTDLSRWAYHNVTAWNQAMRHSQAAGLDELDTLRLLAAGLLNLCVARDRQVTELMKQTNTPLLPWTPSKE